MKKVSIENLIKKEGFFAKAFPVEQEIIINEIDFDYSDIATISEHFAFDFNNSGCMRNGKIITAKTTPIFETPIVLKNLIESNVDEKYYLGNNLEKWEYLKGAKKILRTAKNGHQYYFSEGPVAFPDSLDLPARTMLTSESSLNRSTHVIEDPTTKRLRLITPIEAERIQGFDDNWTNTGMPEKFRYFCMGNALVVPMITKMAKQIDVIFDGE